MNCYNWDTNELKFIDKDKNNFNIKLRGNKQIICGDSSTGKSLLVSRLLQFSHNKNKTFRTYTTDNIFIVMPENIRYIEEQQDKLIVIDRADLMLTPKIVDSINLDRGYNRYLIIGRVFKGLEISPNYYAHMIEKDKTFELKYLYSVRGWF